MLALRALACLAAVAVAACDAPSPDEVPSPRAEALTEDLPPAPPTKPPVRGQRNEPTPPRVRTGPENAPVQLDPPLQPVELRQAHRATMLYDAPSFAAAFRGKVTQGETVHVWRHVEGDAACASGWAEVAPVAFMCLDRSEVVDGPDPVALPRIGTNGLTPHLYAKTRTPDDTAPMWRSRASLRRGDAPEGNLEHDRDYAFVRRRWASRQRILETETRRVVKEADVRRLRPSTFEGVDLEEAPLPTEGRLAWVVRWPDVDVLPRPDVRARPARVLPFQSTLVVEDATVRRRGMTFHALQDGSGWIEATAVRRFVPGPPLPDVDPDTLWLDVDVGQQTLALYRGGSPTFVTLISSGTGKNPTPLGLHRLESKLALTAMRSRPQDDDAYHVEAVPWAMYFDGRYALHGAYWHNRFGNRVSHGCINLAPKDARRIFNTVAPPLPDGWVSVYEHADDLGSLVRIRHGRKEINDRRRPPRRRTAAD